MWMKEGKEGRGKVREGQREEERKKRNRDQAAGIYFIFYKIICYF